MKLENCEWKIIAYKINPKLIVAVESVRTISSNVKIQKMRNAFLHTFSSQCDLGGNNILFRLFNNLVTYLRHSKPKAACFNLQVLAYSIHVVARKWNHTKNQRANL